MYLVLHWLCLPSWGKHQKQWQQKPKYTNGIWLNLTVSAQQKKQSLEWTGNQQNGKYFCNLPIWQRANIQNLQRTKVDLQEKNKQPHQKVGKGYEQALFKRRHLYGQQTYEKMLIITGH